MSVVHKIRRGTQQPTMIDAIYLPDGRDHPDLKGALHARDRVYIRFHNDRGFATHEGEYIPAAEVAETVAEGLRETQLERLVECLEVERTDLISVPVSHAAGILRMLMDPDSFDPDQRLAAICIAKVESGRIDEQNPVERCPLNHGLLTVQEFKPLRGAIETLAGMEARREALQERFQLKNRVSGHLRDDDDDGRGGSGGRRY